MAKNTDNTIQILNTPITGTLPAELLKKVVEKMAKKGKIFIATPNPEFLVFANDNPWFKRVLGEADYLIPDGIGLVWGSKMLKLFGRLGKVIPGRLSGADFMVDLSREAANRNWSVYLVGGKPGIAKKALANLRIACPGLKGYADAGPELTLNGDLLGPSDEVESLVSRINARHPDLLFVALGMGKQEKFIVDNFGKMKVGLAMGVGGAFDYLSGMTRRAPFFVQRMGFEWLWRLVCEPWRIRRQMRLFRFVWLLLTKN